MALVNYTLPFGGGIGSGNWATLSPLQTHHATAVNNLLYGPAGHQESDVINSPNNEQYYKNSPYAPPQHSPGHNQFGRRSNNNYLPPPLPSVPQQIPQTNAGVGRPYQTQTTQSQNRNPYPQTQTPRSYIDESSYPQVPGNRELNNNNQNYYNNYNNGQQQTTRSFVSQNVQTVTPIPTSAVDTNLNINNNNNNDLPNNLRGGSIGGGRQIEESSRIAGGGGDAGTITGGPTQEIGSFPERPNGYTRVQAGQGGRTQVHAVLDYDDDGTEEYYDDDEEEEEGGAGGRNGGNQKTSSMPTVTPIQGPIFVKNGTVPVVPLFAYPTLNNGSLVQIPIWWTALSVALGLDIRGDIIRGVPCVKRYHQLFCPTAGNSYPIDKIEKFIDDNKALMRRMYGDFEMSTSYGPPPIQSGGGTSNKKKKRHAEQHFDFEVPGVPDFIGKPGATPNVDSTGDSYFNKWRTKRQSQTFRGTTSANSSRGAGGQTTRGNQSDRTAANQNTANSENTGRVDACESKVEIVTPYWASNSAGKIRAIVNTQHFEQAIHQEVCVKVQTSRCGGDCGCEQKYKWHRLLAYDPDNDCKGIFMDWFLFPSCCVCRCAP